MKDEHDALLGMILDAHALTSPSLSSSSTLSSSPSATPLSSSTISPSPAATDKLKHFISMQSMVELDQESSTASPQPQTFNSSGGEECEDLTLPITLSNATFCYGCGFEIKEKYMMKVDDHCWHENCLVCCSCRILLTGSTCFSRNGQLYCKQDYMVKGCSDHEIRLSKS